jgi:hypothetical protein
MKKALSFIGMWGLLLTFGALSGAAQGKKSVILKAPFSFKVEHQVMPAGTYRILVEHGWLQIRSADGKTAAMVLTLPVSGKTPEGSGQVVFNRYGDRYFLGQVWLPEMELGRQTLESNEEKEAAKQEKLIAVRVKLESQAGR